MDKKTNKNQTKKRFSKKLVLIRKSLNLSVKELSIRIKVSKGTIFSWEKGMSEPRTKHIIILAKFFKVSVNYLLDLE